ncbi:MAG: Cdc6-like AAA superfamily ATPase, partial [Phenylobacterium sp.]
MLTAEQKKQIKAFHNNLSDVALAPDDPRYVPVFVADSDLIQEDPISEIVTKIALAESASVNLLTGPRGSGKTTELKRLSALLQEDGCIVFHC